MAQAVSSVADRTVGGHNVRRLARPTLDQGGRTPVRVILAETAAQPAILAEAEGEIVLILNVHTTPKPLAATLRRLLRLVDAKLNVDA